MEREENARRRPLATLRPYRFVVPPFPLGWYALAASDEIGPRGVLPRRCFDRELVVFRGDDGVVRVLDAYCPHLGAHLGHGGCVEGDTIRCPFHAWRFDGAGQCVEVPYARRVPPAAKLRAWPVRERNGLVLVWHDGDGGPAEPPWEVPELDAAGSRDWLLHRRISFRIRTHVQEMAENGADSAHFGVLHGMTTHDVRPDVAGHVLHVHSEVRYPESLGGATGRLQTSNYGLGYAIVRFSGVVETVLVVTPVPIDGETVDVRVVAYLRRPDGLTDDALLGQIGEVFVAEVERQFRTDIPIWENKAMLARPVLCDGDGPIGLFRRWTRQFYPALAPDES